MRKQRNIAAELGLPPGYTLGGGGRGGHLFVLDPDGQPLRKANGIPIKVCSTPSDNRSRANERATIRTALRSTR